MIAGSFHRKFNIILSECANDELLTIHFHTVQFSASNSSSLFICVACVQYALCTVYANTFLSLSLSIFSLFISLSHVRVHRITQLCVLFYLIFSFFKLTHNIIYVINTIRTRDVRERETRLASCISGNVKRMNLQHSIDFVK